MPFQQIDSKPVFKRKGISIYPIYRNDDLDDLRREYWYGYSPSCTDDGVDSFDIRDVEGFREGVDHEHFLKHAIADGRLLKLVGSQLVAGGKSG